MIVSGTHPPISIDLGSNEPGMTVQDRDVIKSMAWVGISILQDLPDGNTAPQVFLLSAVEHLRMGGRLTINKWATNGQNIRF